MSNSSSSIRDKILAIQSNLLKYAYVLTSDRDSAYDLVQDTTLKALDSQDKFTDNSNFVGWMFTIMRNLFINEYRRQARSVVDVDHSDDLFKLDAPSVTSREGPDESFAVAEIMSVIDSYPEEYRVPFRLYLAGYRYSEIARRMHLPLGTVKSRIFFARRRLRHDLDDYREDL